MHVILIPAILGFLIKLYLVYVNRFSMTKDKSVFTGLLTVCTLQSLCECIGFSMWVAGNDVDALYRLYYTLSIFVLCFMLLYALEVTYKFKWIGYFLLISAIALSIAILKTDYVIHGYINNDGILNSAKSDYYWTFLLYLLSIVIISLSVLLSKIFTSSEKTKALYVFAAFLTPFAVALTVIVLVHLDVKINSMAVIPISTTFMFIFLAQSENKHLLTDIKRSLPWSKESRISRKTSLILEQLYRGEINRRQYRDELDRLFLIYSLSKTEKKTIAALVKQTGLPRSTVYSLVEKYNIEVWKG